MNLPDMGKFIVTFIFLALFALLFFLFPLRMEPLDSSNPFGKVPVVDKKIGGVSIVSPNFNPDAIQMSSVKRISAGWVAIIPFGFSRENEPEVYFDTERQWIGERVEGTARLIKLAHENELKVLLKPHVWLNSQWIGDFDLDSEEKWEKWETNYANYILAFARLADSLDVEMFCVGTEYKIAVRKRPEFWRSIIKEAKSIFDGPLTYAANWDNYQNVRFWDQLDYIGIDAYFPVSQESDPEINLLTNGWEKTRSSIRKFSRKYGKPVLFTEYGYQSKNGAAGNHWEVESSGNEINLMLQSRAYEALYEVFWQEPWFAGGFLWKWHLQENAGGDNNADFTPQGKPVEATIRKWYKKSL